MANAYQLVGALGGSVVVCLCFMRFYFKCKAFSSSRRLDGKTVIITGANTGIGKETAIDLAARGARVIIACRDQARGTRALQDIKQQSDSQQVYLEQLDLASFKSIRDFSERFKKNEPKLHILINNAGVIMADEVALSEDGLEMTFAVNHLGHFLLTNLLLDTLKKSSPSRIVNLTSYAHNFVKTVKFTKQQINDQETFKGNVAYCESKLANVLFTRELERRLEGSLTGVTSYVVHPGYIYTDIFRNKNWFTKLMVQLIYLVISTTPKQGAQTTIYCAIAEELQGKSGRYYCDCTEQPLASHAKDSEAARKLWDASMDFVGL